MTKAAELAKIVDASGNVVTSGTVEPAGDTAAGDNAAIGFTSAEGIVITGQGSTNDVTIKNDADADVIEIPTGTTNVTVAGTLTATGFIIGSADINENDLESIDGITAGTVAASKAAIVDTNKDITGFRNITLTGELDAATLDVSGDADIDGTLEADAITIGGVTLAETISDTVGAMVSSNTETGITVSYDDADNTLDFVIGTLNQNTTGNAATATALETARTIHGVSFDGSANIDLSEVIQDTVGAMFSSNTETGITATYQDGDGTIDLAVSVSSAADDISAGDAAVNITTSSGNITIDAAANDTDIIFKGTDNNSDITMLTLDGSDAGNATFNGTVLASDGTNSLPSLSFSGDTNTGIYSPSADNLGFAVGGVARAFMSGTQFNMTGNGVFSGTLTASSGDVTITDGNLVVASGHGIDFGATANSGGSMEQELLDDYEEGTWTPALVGLSNTPSFHNNSGRYTKIGRVCTAQFFQQTNVSPTFSSGTAEFKIGGLPFAVDGSGYTGSTGSVSAQALNYHGSNNTQSVSGSGSNGGAYLTSSVNTSEQMQFNVTNSSGTRGIVNNNGAAQGYIIEATVTYFTSD